MWEGVLACCVAGAESVMGHICQGKKKVESRSGPAATIQKRRNSPAAPRDEDIFPIWAKEVLILFDVPTRPLCLLVTAQSGAS